ncbi:MAG: glycine/D-amino acid oxidase-like deaminating enzyme [Verrucomicrobiales bacterium]
MKLQPITSEPRQRSYDVVIVGGAIMGASAAWWLSTNPDFDGSVLVVERDTTYEFASTSLTNSCMRQQFSNEVNIRISQFAADFVNNFRQYIDDGPDVPELATSYFGYMFLAGTEPAAENLRQNQRLQAELGAGTKIMSPEEILAAYPFYNLDGIVCGSLNLVNEGYFDGGTLFDTWRKQARKNGVEFCRNEVVAIAQAGNRITSVALGTGEEISCGAVVNAAGPRAVEVSRMAGFDLPVEARKRYSYIFNAAEPLDGDLPLTIDPSGIHMRSEGDAYQAGGPAILDPAVEYDDFRVDGDMWEDRMWPAIANRVPAFERVKVINRWVGHYAVNTLDHNVIVGPHPDVTNYVFMNGFSGHGLQQSPAMGRGVSEYLTYGEYRSLDLTQLGYQRVLDGVPFVEKAVI